jgi:hypothetical protein
MKAKLSVSKMVVGLLLLQKAVVSGATSEYRSLGYAYLSPEPQAEYTSAQTRFVLVRFSQISPAALTNLSTFITVTGTSSGSHSGHTRIAKDGRTVIFTVSSYFADNELVTVSLNPRIAPMTNGTIIPYQYRFAVTGPIAGGSAVTAGGENPPNATSDQTFDGLAATQWLDLMVPNGSANFSRSPILNEAGDVGTSSVTPGQPGIMANGVSVPSDFPHITITVNTNPDPGYIFIDNRGGAGKPYNVIFDNTGSPVWYQRMPDERRDMKVQPNGLLTMLARTGGYRFVGLNTNYVEVASYWATNGHSTDEHELVVQPDSGYLLIGLRNNTVDMSKYVVGGNPAATVGETVIQEFTAAGELIFQWRAWDHYDIGDLRLDSPTASSMRFPHMNSLEIDTDGHILVSCRHLSEVTKINRNTGEIIWHLGGAHSDFTFVNDSLNGFENHHSIRVTGTNRYVLFDNGDLHNPPVSRGVEYELDLTNRTAKILWQYPGIPTTSLYSWYMGNVQRLTNGNTLINWAVGNLPKLTEVRPNGTKAFEMNWLAGYEAYRVWRCPWQGNALKPNLIIESYSDKLILLFNKFGDPSVGFYRIYGGTSPNPSQVLATSPVTMATLKNLQNNTVYYFRITAVSTNGVESAFSDEQSVLVNLTKPGQNMVVNPGFAAGQDSWIWSVSGSASANWSIVNGAGYIDVLSPGSQLSDIQLRQAGVKLIQGQEYVFEFDAWAAAPRTIEAKLGQDQSPFTGYKIAYPALTPVRTHFKYAFRMQNATDLNTRLVFNIGGSASDVYLDDITVFVVAKGDFDRDRCIGFDDLKAFTTQWLQQTNGLAGDLNGDGKVDFNDFSILAENWPGGSTCP